MSLLDSSRSKAPASTAVVAAAVLVHRAGGLAEVFEALERQVYEPLEVFVVGGGESGRGAAEERGAQWAPDTSRLLSRLGPTISHVWLIHDDARPRPDALEGLVTDLERVDAAVAGSKLLQADRPTILESVGAATDVFETPYFGLERGEMDQQQYDVIRDVAFVSTASLLVRRDLLRGLGGPDREMEPEAASIDFCQRARLAGGRVVVAPSSEVLHHGTCRTIHPPWREEAGRIRAMVKAYAPVTLAWALPLAFLVGLIDAVVRTFLGRRLSLVDFARAWVWNLIFLPGSLAARREARRGRRFGDEELFRYQLRGSSRLRQLGEDLGQRVRERVEEGGQGAWAGLLEIGQDAVHHPGLIGLAAVLLFVTLAVRGVLAEGLPIAGYALSPSGGPLETLNAYAGGWNPAGLGSPEPMRPLVAVMATLQTLVGGGSALAASVATLAAAVGGAIGVARLLRRLGIGPYPRYAAGLVAMAGPATRFMMGEGYWPGLIGLALLPWALLQALRVWPSSWRRRIGRLGALGLLTGLAAAAQPLLVLAVPIALGLWTLVGDRHRLAVLWGAVGAVLGSVLLFPWLYVTEAPELISGPGHPFWTPSWWSLVFLGVAGLSVLLGADRRVLGVGAWGVLLAAIGGLTARASGLGAGTELIMTGASLASLGIGLTTGAALEMWGRRPLGYATRRSLGLVGLLAGIGLVAGTLVMVVDGRLGLPADPLGEVLDFTANRMEGETGRALLVGPPEALPGEQRSVEGAAYRVISVPDPGLEEAWLPPSRLGDQELEKVLRRLGSGETLRVGEELAPFGVRWVVLTGPSPFEQALEVQLDLQPLAGLEHPVFENDADAPRAITDDGTRWEWEGRAYRGEAGERRVYVAENGDSRWGPAPWSQAGWANEVSATLGHTTYTPHTGFRLAAIGVALLAMVLAAAAIWGRGES